MYGKMIPVSFTFILIIIWVISGIRILTLHCLNHPMPSPREPSQIKARQYIENIELS